MRRLSRFFGAGLAALAASSLLAACGSGQTAGGSAGTQSMAAEGPTASKEAAAEGSTAAAELAPVTLKFYMLGEPQPDNAMVFDEINRILKEKVNATIEPSYLSWGEYQQRYPLLFSSGEDFDMIFTASWAFYSKPHPRGAFMS